MNETLMLKLFRTHLPYLPQTFFCVFFRFRSQGNKHSREEREASKRKKNKATKYPENLRATANANLSATAEV